MGAVRIFGDKVQHVIVGPYERPGLVLIAIKEGATCRTFGNPSIRCFRRRNLDGVSEMGKAATGGTVIKLEADEGAVLRLEPAPGS